MRRSLASIGRMLSVAAAAALFILGCRSGDSGGTIVDPPLPKPACGTEVPDPTEMVVGCLVDEDGVPVPRIRVRAGTLEHGGILGKDVLQLVDSATTDSTGRFSLRKLGSGQYYITAEDGSRRHMPTRTVIRQAGDTATKLGMNTLFRNGLLQGTLLDERDGSPLSNVVCRVEGQLYATATLENGRFALYLPSGRVPFLCGVGRRDLIPTRAEPLVVAGDTIDITLSIGFQDEPRPPGPTSLALRYDAATGIIHLTWPPVTPQLGGVVYVLRRTDLSIGSHAFTTFTTKDTLHSDVIPWPKDEDGVVRTRPKDILYNLSTAFPNKVTTLSATMVSSQITVAPPRFLGPEVAVRLLGDKTVFAVGDTALVVGTWRNPYRENRKLAWTLESDGTALKPVLDLPDTAGTDTLAYPCTTAGRFGLRFRVADQSGAAASALQIIEIEPDP